MTDELASCRLCDHDHRRGSDECPARRVGKTVGGKYEITKLLGAGGMGAVYRAKHRALGTEVALKMVHAKFAFNAGIAQRFEREAQHAASLRHPGIVVVSDLGRDDDGTPYLEMELLAGKSVDEIIRSGEMTADRAVKLAIQALDALAFAHDQGLVHRDIKPENLFVTSANGVDHLKVVDFGIAKALTGEGLTATGAVMGTPLYMSPEQLTDSKRVTPRTDVYSMGAALFEMLTGVPPIRGDTLPEVMSKVMSGDISREPSKLRGELPAWVDDVVRRALAHDAKERYASAREMKEALEQRMIGGALVGAVASSASPVGVAATVPPDAPTNAPLAPTVASIAPVTAPAREVAAVSVEPPARRKLLPFAIGGVVVIGGVIAFVATRGTATTAVTETVVKDAAPVDVSAPVDTPPVTPAPPGMIKIAGGTFDMGSTAAEIDAAFKLCTAVAGNECRRDLYEREQPLRKVTISPFHLDAHEVTNDQFAEWLNGRRDLAIKDTLVSAGSIPLLDVHPDHGQLASAGDQWKVRVGRGRWPVVQVSWHAAREYCTAQGKRLPREAEWELAARGTERRVFPWGAEPPACDGVTFGRGPKLPCESQGAHPSEVGTSRVDVTPGGVHDLGGNVGEWVEDGFAERYAECGDCKDPQSAASRLSVVRGGFWGLTIEAARGAGRSRLARDKMKGDIGFRCAKSIEGTP